MVRRRPFDPKHPRSDFLWSKIESQYNPPPPDQMAKRTYFTCPRCYQIYKPQKNYQMYCGDECEAAVEGKINKLKEERLNSVCLKCGLPVRRTQEGKAMTICHACKHQNSYLHSQKKTEEKRLENAAKSKKNRKNLSYSELIRRSEYERVFKDSGWTHYIKGRKWDRI